MSLMPGLEYNIVQQIKVDPFQSLKFNAGQCSLTQAEYCKKMQMYHLFMELLLRTQAKIKSSIQRFKILKQDLRNHQGVRLRESVQRIIKSLFVLGNDVIVILQKLSEQLDSADFKKLISSTTFTESKVVLSQQLSSSHLIDQLKDKQINISILADVIRVKNHIIKGIESVCFKMQYYLSQARIQTKLKTYYKKITALDAQLSTIHLILPYAATFPFDDLFSEHTDDERWLHLKTHYVKKKIYGAAELISDTFNEYVDYITFFMYFVFQIMNKANQIKFLDKDGLFSDNWSEIIDTIIDQKTSQQEIKTIYSLKTQEIPKKLWDITNFEVFKTLINPVLPSINYTIDLFIPKVQRSQLIRSVCNESIKFNYISFIEKPFQIQDYQTPRPYSSHAQLIVNSPRHFFWQNRKRRAQTVLVHIHGGGFISMSSYVHQFYLRKWANELGVPIFSIEYGKAPEHPFPNALADCLQAYLWLVENANKLYNVGKVSLLLIGDSSGGNLACSMLNFIIHNQLPRPQGIILLYPALRVQLFYTPSFLLGMDDAILSHSVLLKIRQAYVGNFPNPNSKYLSPILAESNIFREYPRTHIVTGSRDPLSDDCYRIVEQINKAKQGTAFLTVFQAFPHGFLHFDSDLKPNQYTRKAIDEIQRIISFMLRDIDRDI